MFASARKRLPSIAALLLTALLGGFWATSMAETAECESISYELEEASLRVRQEEGVSRFATAEASHSVGLTKRNAGRHSLRVHSDHFSEHAARNGIGRPLTL